MSYTQGPWFKAGRFVLEYDPNDYVSGGLTLVCQINSEDRADLIAAAPELLEVVEAMANFDGRNNNAALKAMARAAIAKARGLSHD